MKSNSNQIMRCVYPLRKVEKTLRKESIKQANKENQVIEQMGNQLYQPEQENFDKGIGK